MKLDLKKIQQEYMQNIEKVDLHQRFIESSEKLRIQFPELNYYSE
jgi:hypothetical protein